MAKLEISPKIKNFLFLWGPPLLLAGVIYYLSSRPGLAIGDGAIDFWTRKPAHVWEYAVLLVLTFRALGQSFGKVWKLWELAVGAGLLAFLYAVSDEFHQLLVPTRAGKLADLGFDLAGIFLGVAISWLCRRRLLGRS